MHYKTGLNVNVEAFFPSGNCMGYGLYFSSEDILSFLYCGVWIREVTLPKDAKIYKEPGNPVKWKTDKFILGKRKKITHKVVQQLIDEGANLYVNNCVPLLCASERGDKKIVNLMLSCLDHNNKDVQQAISSSIMGAVRDDHVGVLKILVPLAKKSLWTTEVFTFPYMIGKTLVEAARCGATKSVRYLLSTVLSLYDISSQIVAALNKSVENNHFNTAKVILSAVKNNQSMIGKFLIEAAYSSTKKAAQFIDLLVPLSTNVDTNNTALSYAIRECNKELISKLLPIASTEWLENTAISVIDITPHCVRDEIKAMVEIELHMRSSSVDR